MTCWLELVNVTLKTIGDAPATTRPGRPETESRQQSSRATAAGTAVEVAAAAVLATRAHGRRAPNVSAVAETVRMIARRGICPFLTSGPARGRRIAPTLRPVADGRQARRGAGPRRSSLTRTP